MNLNNTNIKQAFIRGFEKKAEQSGLEKSALLPLLLNLAGSLGGAALAGRYLTPAIMRMAAKGATNATAAKGALKNAGPIAKWLHKPMGFGSGTGADLIGGTAGFMGGGMLGDAAGSLLPQDTGQYKQANLSTDDLAAIRLAMQERNAVDPYSDPYGRLNANYNQNILRARDESLNQNPEIEAARAAVSGSIPGLALGALGGSTLGHYMRGKNPAASGIGRAIHGRLPLALGTAGAIIGGIASGIPAYNNRHHAVTSLQKLTSPEDAQRLAESIQADKAILNS
jgi:hypothetical protein